MSCRKLNHLAITTSHALVRGWRPRPRLLVCSLSHDREPSEGSIKIQLLIPEHHHYHFPAASILAIEHQTDLLNQALILCHQNSTVVPG